MTLQTFQALLSLLSLLIAAGAMAWLTRARQALQFVELDKRYATISMAKEHQEAIRQQITGARGAVRREMEALEKRVERADAKSDLAVGNAENALQEANETRTLLEHYHDRIMDDFAKPMERLSDVLHELSQNVAAQGATLNMLIAKERP